MMGFARRRVVDGVRPARTPEELLERRCYAHAEFLPHFFDWLDQQIYEDPHKGLKWAKVVPDLALKITEGDGPEGRQAHRDGLVRAWAMLGGAYRAVGQPNEAETSYQKALKLVEMEAISDLVRVDTDRRLSTLRACQGKPTEALELVEGAVETLRKIAPGSLQLGQALISLGYILLNERQRFRERNPLPEAMDACDEALALVDSAGVPEKMPVFVKAAKRRLYGPACTNLAVAISSGSSRLHDQTKALGYTRRARELLPQDRNPKRYQLDWIDGLIWNQTGCHAKAERLYRKALKGFTALRMPWEAGLVGLDLCALLHLCGEYDELEEIAGDTLELFHLLSGASTQILTTLRLWVDAARSRSWEAENPKDPGKGLREYEELHAAARALILARAFSGKKRR